MQSSTGSPAHARPGVFRSGWPVDAGIALVVGAVQVAGTFAATHWQDSATEPGPPAFALFALGAAALLLRRRHPVPVLLVTLATTVTYFALDYPAGPVVLPLLVALYTAVVAGHRHAAWAGAAGLVLAMTAGRVLEVSDRPAAGQFLGAGSWLLVVLGAGEVVRARRAYLHATEQRAVEAERTREEEARRRAAEERLRIAREVHDVLAHNISLINVQAGVALHLMDERPEQARTALTAIKQASKDTLRELRSTLGVLRRLDEPAPPVPTPGTPTGPMPGPVPAPAQADLTLLGDLAANAAAAGLRVRTEVDGEPRPLPKAVDRAAFRIVQEALTNVARHARPATATVRVTYRDAELTVQVDDDGAATPEPAGGPGVPNAPDSPAAPDPAGEPGPGSGNGIRGMRERAVELGGRLEAGPRPGGGFRVRATLPLDGARHGGAW